MKACGAQLRVDRVNWYLDEKGITDNFKRIKVIETNDLYSSSKPYELMESYKARGIIQKLVEIYLMLIMSHMLMIKYLKTF